jgi:outer membrane lipopolysaccharide assembly protein LptE/RlpB
LKILALVSMALLGSACGYRVAGTANLLPKNIHTIAVVPFGNGTTQYKLSTYLSEAISRELVARTGYAVIADPAKADATLSGGIANIFTNSTVADTVSGRGTGAQIIVVMQVRLVGKDGKVLFNRPSIEFRDRYEISVDTKQYLDESQAALGRLSKDVARTVVSAILENF